MERVPDAKGPHNMCDYFSSPLKPLDCCRASDGQLGKPERQQGTLKLLHTTAFSVQSKPILHTDIHSITSAIKDRPVTLVIRQKDQAAQQRSTSCFMADLDNANMTQHDIWTHHEVDIPCSATEKSSMLAVRHAEV